MKSTHLEQQPAELAGKFLSCKSPRDLAALLEVKYERLVYHVFKVPSSVQYTSFDIPKKTGGTRRIEAPATALKLIQRKLNQVLLACYRPPPCVHGFALKRSILTNAAPHAGRRIVVNIDLADFFGSINFGRVLGLFKAQPYNFPQPLAAFLANIVCTGNHLPQGAPTSPTISNMICRRMDRALQALAAKRRYTYTRYADDLTFSTWRGDVHPGLASPTAAGWAVGSDTSAILTTNGFAPNPKKVRVFGRAQRQEVTGVVVNNQPNVSRTLRKQIRAMLHAWEKYGPDAAQNEYWAKYNHKRRAPGRKPPDFRRVVRGKIEFLRSIVSSADSGYVRMREQLDSLLGVPKPLGPDEALLAERHGNIWVVESPGVSQGTAFRLAGWGFVTCAHVLHEGSVVYRADNLTAKMDLQVLAQDKDLDLAVFTVAAEPQGLPAPLLPRIGKVGLLEAIEVWGFPGHNLGDTVGVRAGHVAGFRPKTGVQRILVNAPIIYGNSGGPVLDSEGRVIGIAVTGAESQEKAHETEAHGVIPITALEYLNPSAKAYA